MEFYLVLPGRCNAQCPTCQWEQVKESENYLDNLKEMLENWPTLEEQTNIQFCPLYIIGGEATLSPVFTEVIELIQPYRSKFSFTSLITNGVNLMEYIPFLQDKINQVVFTRYHFSDEVNDRAFHTKMPSTEQIGQIARELNKHNITSAVNVPMTDDIATIEDITNMIRCAKMCNVSSICFESYSNNAQNPLRDAFNDFIVINNTESPHEFTRAQVIDGFTVKWVQKNSDPRFWSELILLPNMRLTSDWKGAQGYHLRDGRLISLKKKKKDQDQPRRLLDNLFGRKDPDEPVYDVDDMLTENSWEDAPAQATDSFHKTIQDLLNGRKGE